MEYFFLLHVNHNCPGEAQCISTLSLARERESKYLQASTYALCNHEARIQTRVHKDILTRKRTDGINCCPGQLEVKEAH